MTDALDRLCIDTIRTLSIDAVQKANSGHPGLPMGAAPMAHVLWQRYLKHDPAHPAWPDRDRFVLSAGHGSMLIYALLHLNGYDLSMEDLKQFRQWGSKTPGHPEFGHTAGVECTTGPLGQGSANAVGMAMAERWLANRYNRSGHTIVDHHTYALVSDGDVMEGISAEAASLAGHLRLGKLIYLYDANQVSLDGPTSLTFTEDVGARYATYGWHVQTVADGNADLVGLDVALAAAKAETNKPSLIVVRTTIGFGSPNKGGTADAHGSPLGADEVALTKRVLGWDPEQSFHVPDEARAHFLTSGRRGAAAQAAWRERFEAWAAAHPQLAGEWELALAGELPAGWDAALPKFGAGDKLATRQSGGKALNGVAARVPWFVGGDADLSCSTKTAINGAGSFHTMTGDGTTSDGRNVHFGVREHAMGAIANGMSYHGGIRPYTATFFVFSDYMRPAMRLAALNRLPVVHVFTHDSIAVGEDGPTHQPVEHLASLRAMPGMHVVRPGNAAETSEAYRYALERGHGPTTIVLSRQSVAMPEDLVPVAATRFGAASGLHRGGYVVLDPEAGEPEAILIGTGAELALALEASRVLAAEGIATRVVSLPCWEAFEAEDAAYREAVLPSAIQARVAVEAGTSFGWARWIGSAGRTVCVDTFGASAPGEVLLEKYGFTAENVAKQVREALATRVAGAR